MRIIILGIREVRDWGEDQEIRKYVWENNYCRVNPQLVNSIHADIYISICLIISLFVLLPSKYKLNFRIYRNIDMTLVCVGAGLISSLDKSFILLPLRTYHIIHDQCSDQ